ncbi:hypothetical protein [Stappia sp. P2PMeth1]|uniref:hypothetical protein n=1 Tax=Stappia sp. P2PMeth1 TaxID=2003586 RepID=UPI0016445946|nr:hypothetical protein [Stappia sp. P2PMeth1]
MVSVWTSNLATKVLAGIALLFGIATLVSGGNALFDLYRTETSTAKIVPFVLHFNFAAGFAYIATGAGLMLKRGWAPISALAIAAATAIVFLGLVGWILAGNAYEMRTVVAMSLRTAFWSSLAIISLASYRQHSTPPNVSNNS